MDYQSLQHEFDGLKSDLTLCPDRDELYWLQQMKEMASILHRRVTTTIQWFGKISSDSLQEMARELESIITTLCSCLYRLLQPEFNKLKSDLTHCPDQDELKWLQQMKQRAEDLHRVKDTLGENRVWSMPCDCVESLSGEKSIVQEMKRELESIITTLCSRLVQPLRLEIDKLKSDLTPCPDRDELTWLQQMKRRAERLLRHVRDTLGKNGWMLIRGHVELSSDVKSSLQEMERELESIFTTLHSQSLQHQFDELKSDLTHCPDQDELRWLQQRKQRAENLLCLVRYTLGENKMWSMLRDHVRLSRDEKQTLRIMKKELESIISALSASFSSSYYVQSLRGEFDELKSDLTCCPDRNIWKWLQGMEKQATSLRCRVRVTLLVYNMQMPRGYSQTKFLCDEKSSLQEMARELESIISTLHSDYLMMTNRPQDIHVSREVWIKQLSKRVCMLRKMEETQSANGFEVCEEYVDILEQVIQDTKMELKRHEEKQQRHLRDIQLMFSNGDLSPIFSLSLKELVALLKSLRSGWGPPLELVTRMVNSKCWVMEADLWADLLIVCCWANPTTNCDKCDKETEAITILSCNHTVCLLCIVKCSPSERRCSVCGDPVELSATGPQPTRKRSLEQHDDEHPCKRIRSLEPLRSDDLLKLYTKLLGVSTRWYDFGLALGIHFEKLDEIQQNYEQDCRSCLRETLKKKLENSEDGLPWEEVIEALKSPLVEKAELAGKLKRSYLVVNT